MGEVGARVIVLTRPDIDGPAAERSAAPSDRAPPLASLGPPAPSSSPSSGSADEILRGCRTRRALPGRYWRFQPSDRSCRSTGVFDLAGRRRANVAPDVEHQDLVCQVDLPQVQLIKPRLHLGELLLT